MTKATYNGFKNNTGKEINNETIYNFFLSFSLSFCSLQHVHTVPESHHSHNNCDIEQHLLYTHLCDMDDNVAADKAVPSRFVFQNRGLVFPLAAVGGIDVVVDGWLWQ